MKSQPRYQPGDRIGGRYQVHDVKMGGMGEVYLCLDLEENYPYALKTFQQQFVTNAQRLTRMFEQEVETWMKLEKHPNIVRCFNMETRDQQPFMVLEWVAGEEGHGVDLRSWLRRGSLDLQLALQIAIDVCHGLIHAQTKRPGLVHRDLKPENILIAQGSVAKITDFGLAKIVASTGLTVAQDNEGQASIARGTWQSLITDKGIVGTPAYMAPEQWQGETLDGRTDIYALGCLLYEVLTGHLPFPVVVPANTPNRKVVWLHMLQEAHAQAPVARLPEVLPDALNDVVQQCLAKTPAARYSDGTTLLCDLTSVYQAACGQPPRPLPALSPFTAIDYTNRGVTYRALGQLEAAVVDYTQAITLDPNLAQAYYNRGIIYHDLGQLEAAVTDYTHALSIDPHYAKAYFNRGNTYRALGQLEAAVTDYTQAIIFDPNDPKAYYNRGETYQALGQLEAAVTDYTQAIIFDPNDAKAYNNRGNTYQALGQNAAALTDFAQALTLTPTLTQAYYNRGVTYQALGEHEAALADFTHALAIDPHYAKAYNNRGVTYQALGQEEEAVADYTQALTFDPHYAKAYLNIGAVLANRGELREALPYLERAAALGHARGAQFATQVREMLGTHAEVDPVQAAFDTFQQADSLVAMQQAVIRYPILLQPDFRTALEQVSTEQLSLARRPVFEQRLAWLQQIANTHPRSTP